MNVNHRSLPVSGSNNLPPFALDRPESAEGEIPKRLGADERVRLMRDGLFNNASIVISGLISIVLVPIMLRGLGSESYGLWIAALSVAGTVGLFDFGLGVSVTREAAATLGSGVLSEAAPFIKGAGIVFLSVGIGGGIVIATLGLPLSGELHLSTANREIAPAVFALAGVSFLADRLLAFTTAVLRGLRRFDISNLLAGAAAVLRAVGIIALVRAGTGLQAVMMWQVVATAAAALAGQWAVSGIAEEFRFRLGRFDWKLVRSKVPFGLASQLTTIVEVIIWDVVPLVVGLVLGSIWIVPYYIAQRFPTSVGLVIWSFAEAMFPAVSQHQRDQDIARTREILEVGTRWIVVVALPLCLGLWIVAPRLLQAWVGHVPPDSVLILRLITAAVFIEGFAAASIQVLWGRGATRPLVIIPSCLMVASLGLTLVLLHHIGVAGAAWGLVVPMFLASLVYIRIGTRTCGMRVWDLISVAYAGLLLPVLAFLIICFSITSLTGPGWVGVVAATVAGGLGYLLCFILVGAREEELMLARKVIDSPRAVVYDAYGRFRHALARIGFLRSGYHLLRAIGDALLDSPARGQAELNHEFEPREDPWDYTTVQYQKDRISGEVEMLDAVRGRARFGKALEVGCAEGLFTEVLAARCESLLALDISPVALRRARRRLQGNEHVDFAEWDLRVDPVPGTYDLIVIIHALEYIRNPIYIRKARTKLVNALRPGGYLLLGTMKVAAVYEDAWWGRYLLRSGRRINSFFAKHPAVEVVRTAEIYLGKDYVAFDVLLRKPSERTD